MDATRERILAAARETCSESGFAADAKAISLSARVSEPTLYRRFGTRMGLLEALLEEMLDSAESRLAEISRDRDAGADAMIRAINVVGFYHVRVYGQLASEVTAGKLPADLRHHLGRVHRLWALMGSVIKLGIGRGHLRPDVNPRIWVIAWRSLVTTDSLEAFRVDGGVISHEEMAEVVTDFLLRGLDNCGR